MSDDTQPQPPQTGDIIYLGDNMPYRIRKPYTDWRGHIPGGDYNGYVKIISVTDTTIKVFPLYGNPDGHTWIAHPVRYDRQWNCREPITD